MGASLSADTFSQQRLAKNAHFYFLLSKSGRFLFFKSSKILSTIVVYCCPIKPFEQYEKKVTKDMADILCFLPFGLSAMPMGTIVAYTAGGGR